MAIKYEEYNHVCVLTLDSDLHAGECEGVRKHVEQLIEKKQIVEMRQLALRPEAADVVDAGRGSAVDFGDGVLVERRRGTRRGRGAFIVGAHQY